MSNFKDKLFSGDKQLLEEIESLKKENNDLKIKNKELQDDINSFIKEIDTLRYHKTNADKLIQKIASGKEGEYLKGGRKLKPNQSLADYYGPALSFCNGTYIEYFLRDDFADRLNEITKSLDKTNERAFKWYLLRALSASTMRKKTLYFDNEKEQMRLFRDFRLKNSSPDGIAGFKFTGDFNLSPFIDLNLTQSDLEFLKNKDMIDAGAYTGDTSLPLSKLTDKKIYAFEPFEGSFKLLKKNIEDNNITNIVPINKSIGNINGERSLYLSGDNVQGITSDANLRENTKEIIVQEVTIDEFVKQNNLDVGYITVDVEGAEMDLLNGAVNTIKTQKPILVISIYHKASDFMEIIPWIANLGLGYEFEIFKEKPSSFIADIVVQCRVKR